ncbi:MAG: peroxidase [Propionibacteriales bacterium]|nr:peroxidase [Propionibacteriales bacterium]
MSYLASTTEAPPSDDAAAMYERDLARLGYVANYTKAFAHRPDVMRAWEGLNGSIKAGMDLRRYELATLAAAERLRSIYCSLAHGKVLAELDSPKVVRDLVVDRAAADVSPLDVAIMDLAEKVAGGAADITADDLRDVRTLGLTDAEILDVILAAAARCFFSTVLSAVGAEPDAFAELDADLREALITATHSPTR